MPNQPPIPSKGWCPEIALGHFQANSLPTVLEDQPEAPRLVGWNRPNIEPQTKRLGWLEFRPFFVAKCVVVRFLFTWKKGKIMESGKKVLMVKKKSVDNSVFCTIAASDHVPSRNFQIPNPLQIFKIMFVQPTKKRNADINKKNTEKKQHGSGKKILSNHFLPSFF